MIRPANESDRLSIGKVYCDVWKSAYAGIISADFLSRLSAENCAPPHIPAHRAFVYEQEGQVAGVVHFGASRDTQSENSGEIYSIYVLPSLWRRGAGRALFHTAAQKLRENGFTEFCLWTLEKNIRAIRFYKKMGMTRFSQRSITIGGQNLKEIGFILQFERDS